MDWSKLTLIEGRQLLAQPCFEVTLFSFAPASECGPGFGHFLSQTAAAFGDRFKFYMTGDMKRFRPFDAHALEAPYHWFSEPNLLSTKKLALMVHSGAVDKSIESPSLQLALMGSQQPPCFVFRLTLPPQACDSPDEVVAFLQEALDRFPLDSGHAGYSFLWNRLDLARERTACAWSAPLLLRHPGLGYGSAVRLSNAASDGVAAVSWLTFLGPRLTRELGGREAVARAVAPIVSVLPIGAGGVLLRAGQSPQLGDVNRRELLPEYRAVGRVVAPIRASDKALREVVVLGMDDDKADDWLRRFFS